MSIEQLERDFHQHLIDDRRHHEKIVAALAGIEIAIKDMGKDVDKLNEKVLIGNGTDSVLTRLKSIEDYIKSTQQHKRDRRWNIETFIATIGGLSAVVASCVAVYSLLNS